MIDRVSDETPSESVPDDIAGAGSEPSSGDPSEDSGKSLDVQDYTPEDVEEVNLCVLGERPQATRELSYIY